MDNFRFKSEAVSQTTVGFDGNSLDFENVSQDITFVLNSQAKKELEEALGLEEKFMSYMVGRLHFDEPDKPPTIDIERGYAENGKNIVEKAILTEKELDPASLDEIVDSVKQAFERNGKNLEMLLQPVQPEKTQILNIENPTYGEKDGQGFLELIVSLPEKINTAIREALTQEGKLPEVATQEDSSHDLTNIRLFMDEDRIKHLEVGYEAKYVQEMDLPIDKKKPFEIKLPELYLPTKNEVMEKIDDAFIKMDDVMSPIVDKLPSIKQIATETVSHIEKIIPKELLHDIKDEVVNEVKEQGKNLMQMFKTAKENFQNLFHNPEKVVLETTASSFQMACIKPVLKQLDVKVGFNNELIVPKENLKETVQFLEALKTMQGMDMKIFPPVDMQETYDMLRKQALQAIQAKVESPLDAITQEEQKYASTVHEGWERPNPVEAEVKQITDTIKQRNIEKSTEIMKQEMPKIDFSFLQMQGDRLDETNPHAKFGTVIRNSTVNQPFMDAIAKMLRANDLNDSIDKVSIQFNENVFHVVAHYDDGSKQRINDLVNDPAVMQEMAQKFFQDMEMDFVMAHSVLSLNPEATVTYQFNNNINTPENMLANMETLSKAFPQEDFDKLPAPIEMKMTVLVGDRTYEATENFNHENGTGDLKDFLKAETVYLKGVQIKHEQMKAKTAGQTLDEPPKPKSDYEGGEH